MFWIIAFCVYGIAAGICIGEWLSVDEKFYYQAKYN